MKNTLRVKPALEIMKILVARGYRAGVNGTWTGPGLSFSPRMWSYCGLRIFKQDGDGDYVNNGYFFMPEWVEDTKNKEKRMAKTDEQYKDYLGLRCPYCHSDMIHNANEEGWKIAGALKFRYEPMKCSSCGNKWDARFILDGWDEAL